MVLQFRSIIAAPFLIFELLVQKSDRDKSEIDTHENRDLEGGSIRTGKLQDTRFEMVSHNSIAEL